jgi:phosphate transport system permease protein
VAIASLPPIDAAPDDLPEEIVPFVVHRNRADRVFRRVVVSSAASCLIIMMLIGLFLAVQSWDALSFAGLDFFTETAWSPDTGEFGIASVMLGTALIAMVALVIAVPLSVLAALFITDYCPARLRRPLTSLVDLLAAVPSLVYGLWGAYFLQPRLLGLSRWLGDNLGFIPFFRVQNEGNFAASAFIAGVVVSLMVIPIATSVMREVFGQAPPGEKEGALALGGTRWGVVRHVVLPFGRGGIIGGSMLGLGRALGETIAVAVIISPSLDPSLRILDNGGISVAALIALRWSEASDFHLSALIAAGLALFVLTLAVNAMASVIVARSRSGSATEI